MITMVLSKVINEVWPMMTVFTVAIILIRLMYLKVNHEKIIFYRECMYLFSIIYFWLLFEFLTITEINTNSSINIIPFEEIFRYEVGSQMFIFNVFGNILIFLPFGYLISAYIKPKSIWPILSITAIISTLIEFIQLNIGRSFDVDDIILNVTGALVGFLLYVALKAISKYLPDFFKRELFYNIIWVLFIAIVLIYFFGYWGVVFK